MTKSPDEKYTALYDALVKELKEHNQGRNATIRMANAAYAAAQDRLNEQFRTDIKALLSEKETERQC